MLVTGTMLVDSAVAVVVGVTICVDVEVTVTVDWGSVVVAPGPTAQEQADEYLTVPEQAEAYVGTLLAKSSEKS